MENKKTYWKGIEQLTNRPEFIQRAEKEFAEHLPIKDAYGDNTQGFGEANRRDFLKLMGFSLTAVSLAACEAPVKKAIPYLNKPEDVDPGIPNYYASTFIEGGEVCPVVVKTREGRPIFVQGNHLSKLTKGATNVRVNASVLNLYDNEKIKYPTIKGEQVEWKKLDEEIIAKLSSLAAAGKPVVIVSNTICSPSTRRVIKQFQQKYPNVKHVQYDPYSASAILEAHKLLFNKPFVPSFDFSKAKTIVSFGADFLCGWVHSTEFEHQWAENRKVSKQKKEMSKHFQFESILSLTGANADYRTPIKPSQEGLAVVALYNLIAAKAGVPSLAAAEVQIKNLDKAAASLWENRGNSLVVSGSTDVAVQAIIAGINNLLDNYGATIDINRPLFVKQGNDSEMYQFVKELTEGKIGGVIFYNANPVYDYPLGNQIANALKNVELSVATADRLNETASLCQYNAPDSHWLESWNDAEPKKGFFSLSQPTISTIFSTRQVQQSLLVWAQSQSSYYDVIKEYWTNSLFKFQNTITDPELFWQTCLHDGIFEPQITNYYSQNEPYLELEVKKEEKNTDKKAAKANAESDSDSRKISLDLSAYASAINNTYKPNNEGIEFVAFVNGTIGTGAFANNPILQETPEPISKVTWGNYVSIPVSMSKQLGIEVFENKVSVAEISINGQKFKLPVIAQPGQANNVIAVPVGYGRSAEQAGKVAAEAGGVNVYPFLTANEKGVSFVITQGVGIVNTGEKEFVAQTQTHHTIMGRESIIQETTLAEYQKNEKAGKFEPYISTYKGKERPTNISLWDIHADGYTKDERIKEKVKEPKDMTWNERLGYKADVHPYNNHHWGMVIDLNACTGCSACIVACHTENNVAVVGKKEVIMRREMHWLRIDRYYSHSKEVTSYAEMEEATENPEVVFQPMMCQHCNNAPCETVCPVAATTHSSEGINQMTYNRCIGTKYCANNCPYKVRRFNWFKYHDNDEFDYFFNNDLGKMVINPDVTVRSRGVMEKCSFCVQRIQAGKLKAKKENRRPVDGEIITACAAACASGAIKFGDLNDFNSEVRQIMEQELEGRAYAVLEELNVRPNVWYLRKVRNNEGSNV
ncbi:MAG: TAT-variant-translocated molybdopterin oxidoreductase [Cytophagales bacterium]|nr:TAT-variant-translocated molybdopterin oxidoreductase [Cytophagales bacterium]MDW8384888.1 TAT-variant-translocated molybdopterin oxidoreductase [Flammeovirgaceae bacterium]